MNQSMLILLAHGSRDPRWRESLEGVLAPLSSEGGTETVRVGFMELANPSLDEMVLEAVALGIQTVRILPLFIASAGHVDRDILPAVRRLRIVHPDVHLILLKPIGEHEGFADWIREIARKTAADPGIVDAVPNLSIH